MPRPRSSTFYLPLAPADAPLSLKAKLSVLPPSAANALLAPRCNTATTPSINGPSTHNPVPPLDYLGAVGHNSNEDECARLERVLGLNASSNAPVSRRTARRHTDAPLPQRISNNPFAIPPPLSTAPPSTVVIEVDDALSRTSTSRLVDPSLPSVCLHYPRIPCLLTGQSPKFIILYNLRRLSDVNLDP